VCVEGQLQESHQSAFFDHDILISSNVFLVACRSVSYYRACQGTIYIYSVDITLAIGLHDCV
jgi:hypothetical protein